MARMQSAGLKELHRFPIGVQDAVQKVRTLSPMFGPGWTVCLRDRATGRRAQFELNNHEQVSQLALELARLGYALSVSSDQPCDYLFEYGGAPAEAGDAAAGAGLTPS